MQVPLEFFNQTLNETIPVPVHFFSYAFPKSLHFCKRLALLYGVDFGKAMFLLEPPLAFRFQTVYNDDCVVSWFRIPHALHGRPGFMKGWL